MIVLALVTTVALNLGLCGLLFGLYSVLRNRPGNVKIYAPRLLARDRARAQRWGKVNIDSLLPSTGWVRQAWQPSEDELLATSGLDGVVFMRIFIFSLRVFSVAGVVGVFILLPVNYLGDQFSDIDFSDLPNMSLDLFSISNVENGSNRLWVHFSAAYLLTGVVCYLLYYTNAENMYRRLTHLKSRSHTSQNFRRGGFLGLFGQNVDIVGQYSKKLEELEETVRIEQSDVSMAGKEIPAAFVCFKSRYGAATALHINQSINPTQWVTEQAPDPHDVYWPFFSASFMQRWISKLVVFVASVILIVVFLIPVAFIQGLTYLEQLELLFPFLKGILTTTIISKLITGYLPSLILQMFLSFIPPILKLFSTMQGYIAHSEIEKSACRKMLWFSIWNIFFANALTGSVAIQLKIILDPKDIPVILAVAVPAQATFFIAYVVTSWTSLSLELSRMKPLSIDWIQRLFSGCMSDEFHTPFIRFHKEIPRLLLFGLIGLAYFLLAPLILPFILVFFCIGYIIFRNKLLNVYFPKYETGGRFWPIVHNSTIFSLLLMQAIAIGIFALKKLPLASSLVLPLPVLTLLFNEYCRKRFLPIFSDYSAESLIKKDREDQNDPAMNDFFSKLVNAYRDPALMPIRHTLNTNERNSPLLSSAEF